jgi:hypothetical protein
MQLYSSTFSDQILEHLGFNRLGEMIVKTSLFCSPPVIFLAITRHGDQVWLFQLRVLAQLRSDFKTIHTRQANVEQDDVGLEDMGYLQGCRAVMSSGDLPPKRRCLQLGNKILAPSRAISGRAINRRRRDLIELGFERLYVSCRHRYKIGN